MPDREQIIVAVQEAWDEYAHPIGLGEVGETCVTNLSRLERAIADRLDVGPLPLGVDTAIEDLGELVSQAGGKGDAALSTIKDALDWPRWPGSDSAPSDEAPPAYPFPPPVGTPMSEVPSAFTPAEYDRLGALITFALSVNRTFQEADVGADAFAPLTVDELLALQARLYAAGEGGA